MEHKHILLGRAYLSLILLLAATAYAPPLVLTPATTNRDPVSIANWLGLGGLPFVTNDFTTIPGLSTNDFLAIHGKADTAGAADTAGVATNSTTLTAGTNISLTLTTNANGTWSYKVDGLSPDQLSAMLAGLTFNAATATSASTINGLQGLTNGHSVAVTVSNQLSLRIPAGASTREVLLLGKVSDAGNDAGGFCNAAIGDNLFVPTFWGYLDSGNANSSFQLRGMVSAANDASDSGTFGILDFAVFRTTSATNPNAGTLGTVANRKVFSVRSGTAASDLGVTTYASRGTFIGGTPSDPGTDALRVKGALSTLGSASVAGSTISTNGFICPTNATPPALTISGCQLFCDNALTNQLCVIFRNGATLVTNRLQMLPY